MIDQPTNPTPPASHQYGTGPRTNLGVCPAFQRFTWEHLPRDGSYFVTDVDGVCVNHPYLALLEDKKRGKPCNPNQRVTLEVVDQLLQIGLERCGGVLRFTVDRVPHTVRLTYLGLVFRTDIGVDGFNILYECDMCPPGTETLVERAECYGLDAIIRTRAGQFMTLRHGYRHCEPNEARIAIHRAVDALLCLGMKATGGCLRVASARYPLRLKYHGQNVLQYDNSDDIAGGNLWWNDVEADLRAVVQALNFGRPVSRGQGRAARPARFGVQH